MTGKHPRFAWDKAIRGSDLSPTARLVALVYACYLGGDGQAWPSNSTLARECGTSESTAKRGKTELIKAGFLVEIRKGSGPGISTKVEARIPVANRLTGEPDTSDEPVHLDAVTGSSEGVVTGSPMSHEQPRVEQLIEQPIPPSPLVEVTIGATGTGGEGAQEAEIDENGEIEKVITTMQLRTGMTDKDSQRFARKARTDLRELVAVLDASEVVELVLEDGLGEPRSIPDLLAWRVSNLLPKVTEAARSVYAESLREHLATASRGVTESGEGLGLTAEPW